MEKMKDQQRFRRLVLVVYLLVFIFLISFLHDTFSEPKLSGFSSGNRQGVLEDISMEINLRRLVTGKERDELDERGFSCDSDPNSNVCVSTKQLRINTQNLTIHVSSIQGDSETLTEQFIKPYPGKDQSALKSVQPLKIVHVKNSTFLPTCNFYHMIPVIIFSSGGFAGNTFHSFNDILIPLFLTSRHFRYQVKFMITDYKPWWVRRYDRIFKGLSGFGIIDSSRDYGVHCFPGGVIRIKYHKYLGVNSSDVPNGYKFDDFRHFLWDTYGLNKGIVSYMKPKRVLVLISRQKTRVFLNEDEMVRMMEGLGFEVKVVLPNDMRDLIKFSRLVGSCDIMVGAHGAGLVNEVFLPKGSVVVQVVPLGLKWLSNVYFAKPASEMGLKYLDYQLDYEESSLSKLYSRYDPIITNPSSVFNKGYMVARTVYLTGQNMSINVDKFKKIIVHALEII